MLDISKPVFITGCSGFIASNLVDYLLSKDFLVVGYDNLSSGKISFLDNAKKNKNFKFFNSDILNLTELIHAMKGVDFVFHLAANADVRFGINKPDRDLNQNTIGTFNVLEAMRLNGISKIAFSSTGSVYGEAEMIPTPENAPFPIQTSLYGASKLAGEGLLSAYSYGFNFQVWIFRFVSILGERYSHGHVYDFYKQLLKDPTKLAVLGNGKQRKSYLYVGDCIEAIIVAIEKSNDKVNILNLGTDEYCEVNDSIGWISEHLKLKPVLSYTGTERGWIGDNPFIFLDTKKVRNLGWKPKYTIKEGIIKTIQYLENNQWLLNEK
jgi:UDP-glucose 4-epimerase